MTKLRPRARIIRTIGDQLISGPEAALIELVKNAYDADSPYVRLQIVPPNDACPSGFIGVQDQGHGMSFLDVVERWFEPATDEKLKRVFSPKGRRMLGAKGIGRFAASRLGTKTVLRTASISDGITNLVQIDWDQFTADRYLEDVEIPITQADVQTMLNGSGVQLSITDLRDQWTKKRTSNLIKELRRVISPSDTASDFRIYLDLTAFTQAENGFDGKELLRKLNFESLGTELDANDGNLSEVIVPFRLNNFADYRLSGAFDSEGKFSGEFVIFKGDNVAKSITVPPEPMEDDEAGCGPIDLHVNVYDREAESIEDLFKRMGLDFGAIGIRSAREILTDNAGIAIFRNNFRIRPYGEPENDWLELERMRVQDPSKKLGLSQVSGKVEIAVEEISGLIERSSREGLEHNGEFARLKSLILNVLRHVEELRVGFREKAGLSRKRSTSVQQVKELANLQAVTRVIAQLPPEHREKMQQAVTKDISALVASLEEVDEYQKLLQSRASLGSVVAQVIHEGRRILNPMSTAAKALFDQHGWYLEETKRGEIARKQLPDHVQTIQGGTKDMSRLFKRLDPVSGRRRGRPINFNVQDAIQSCLALFKDLISDRSIRVHLDIPSLHVYGYAEDFHAAVLNIVENAIHWLGVSNQEEKTISILAKKFEENVRVAILNNGPPIDENYLPRLFDAGFSLRSGGTGLGLAIAREACRASKGELVYNDKGDEPCFIIQFPVGI